MKSLILPSLLSLAIPSAFALTTGDIAFTGFNADGSDNLSFVALVPIPSGTEIHFTDDEWTGSAFNADESKFTWTAGSNITAGAIVKLDTISTTATSNLGTVAFTQITNTGISNSTEIVYAYVGTPTAPTAFLTAIANNLLTSSSAIVPTGLVAGTNAIELNSVDADCDIAAYTGTRTSLTSFGSYLSPLNNPVNWVAQDGSGDQSIDTTSPDVPFSSSAFSVTPPPITSVDLSNYVRVGRYDLPEYRRTALPVGTPTHNLLCDEASGVAYNWDTDTLFIVGDGGVSVTQVSKTGVLIDTMTLALGSSPQGTDFYDPEGITYIGGGQFVFSEERDQQLVKFTYAAGTTLTRATAQTVVLGPFDDNTGTEGLSWDPPASDFICLKEKTPIGVFRTGVDFGAGTSTVAPPITGNETSNLFSTSLLGMTDVADVFAFTNLPSMAGQPQENNLLILGQEDARIVNIGRTGVISSTLNITGGPGDIPVGGMQHEGITMDRAGNIYVVNENGGGNIQYPQLWVFAPSALANAAPTAVVLSNAVNSVLENTGIASPFKVGDIFVTDDGLGTNTLSLSGTDAAFFEITGTALFLKAGTVLDFETKTSYSVTINADDLTLGATPDATLNFTLNVTDQEPETTPAPVVIISETAPWASSLSAVADDWFELTNISEDPITVTGWKADDGSNSYALGAVLGGVTTIAPGESVIFLLEVTAAELAAKTTSFVNTWFGGTAPVGLQIGYVDGGGLGLGSSGDSVNIFNAAGLLQAKVSFGAQDPESPYQTFDNTVGANNATISLLSQVGVNGAFVAATSATEIGSPGYAAPGVLRITEAAPWSSGNSPVAADWFEVTNIGARAVSIDGWKFDDVSESFASGSALTGITSIAPDETVIFIQTGDLATASTTFKNNWFGASPPAGLQIGAHTGDGLGTTGDAVNLFDSNGTPRAKLAFGASPTGLFGTFDNTAALDAVTVTLKSVPGVNGAFIAANSADEIGSPGTATAAGPQDFALWLTAKGYSSRGFGTDSDLDGITDGVEFFFNANPNSGGTSGNLPVITIVGGETLLTFTTLDALTVVSGTLEVSDDLGQLDGWATAMLNVDYETVSSTSAAGQTTTTLRLLGPASTKFWRHRVTTN
jgi:uncharacterized protein YjiK